MGTLAEKMMDFLDEFVLLSEPQVEKILKYIKMTIEDTIKTKSADDNLQKVLEPYGLKKDDLVSMKLDLPVDELIKFYKYLFDNKILPKPLVKVAA